MGGGEKKKAIAMRTKKNPQSGTSGLQYSRFFGAVGTGEGKVWQLLKKVLLIFRIT